MVASRPGACSLASMDSLVAYMQQTLLQYPCVCESLEPTHWMNASFFGSWWSEGLARCPPVGPDADSILSSWSDVTTSLQTPRQYWDITLVSMSSKPVATMIAAASTSMSLSFWS